MLYLIRTFGRGKDRTSLKVGFSDDLKKRLETYRIQNPFFELLGLREGNEVVEKKLHLYLQAKSLKDNFMDEWFLDVPEVLQYFHTHIPRVEQGIWKKRDMLFSAKDFQSYNLKARIYEELLGRFEVQKRKEVDKSWIMEKAKRELKLIKKSNEYGGKGKRI